MIRPIQVSVAMPIVELKRFALENQAVDISWVQATRYIDTESSRRHSYFAVAIIKLNTKFLHVHNKVWCVKCIYTCVYIYKPLQKKLRQNVPLDFLWFSHCQVADLIPLGNQVGRTLRLHILSFKQSDAAQPPELRDTKCGAFTCGAFCILWWFGSFLTLTWVTTWVNYGKFH